MNNDKTVKEVRDVAPQWASGKGMNLGDFTVKTVGFSGRGVSEFCSDPNRANAIAHALNNQLHIMLGSRLCQDKVEAHGGLRAKLKDEKLADYRDATLTEARSIAKGLLPSAELDYVKAFSVWADVDFPKKGAGKDNRPELANFDGVVAGINSRWDDFSEVRRTKMLTDLGMNPDLCKADIPEVLAALEATFRRPKLVVDTDEMFK